MPLIPVEVVPFSPIHEPYTYLAPKGIKAGQFVKIDVRGRKLHGVVWKILDQKPNFPLKEIFETLPLQEVSQTSLEFAKWVADYTLAPLGSVLKMLVGSEKFLSPPSPEGYYTQGDDSKLTPTRQKVLDAINNKKPDSLQEIHELSGVSLSTIQAMKKAGQLVFQEIKPEIASEKVQLSPLNEEQSGAYQKALPFVQQQAYQPFLLEGITGSGKTEVYFHLIQDALQQNKQCLILLPEIALSTQTLMRFQQRFGSKACVWHSDLPVSHKHRTFHQILNNQAKVIVGARSALFLPFPELGLIVVDEEHESSFKQEEGVIYHARDMAVVRAHIENIPIVLASATPSLESLSNVQAGKYQHLKLTQRFQGATLPEMHLIDMRKFEGQTKKQFWLSPPLVEALKTTLEKGEQAALFLNRRGYAPITLCKSCGDKMGCPHCSSWLVTHKQTNLLTCHHCGYDCTIPKECPKCHEADSFLPFGPGIERIKEEVERLFPNVRIGVMDRDCIKTPKDLENLLKSILEHKIDILIGTQMIAKGHHFPGLTTVGIIDADLGLGGSDLRACEKTYQLLHQVSGRAGREQTKGHVYLQTFSPDHPVILALLSGEFEEFLSLESSQRELLELPPFSRLAAVIISGENEHLVQEQAALLVRRAPHIQGVEIIGPAPALLAKLRGRYRWRILVKSPKNYKIQNYLKTWIKQTPKLKNNLRIQVDIDPYSFV